MTNNIKVLALTIDELTSIIFIKLLLTFEIYNNKNNNNFYPFL